MTAGLRFHRTPEKIAFHMRTPVWCRAQAEKVGPACVELVGGLLAENALYRLRASQGVLGLADRHDPDDLQRALGALNAFIIGALRGEVSPNDAPPVPPAPT